MTRQGEGATTFCVTRAGDLALASLTFDVLRERHASLRMVTSPEAAPLLDGDDRFDDVAVVSSTSALGWRAAVARQLWRARRRGDVVVNLELYLPRWRFIRRAARALRFPLLELDLPALRAGDGDRVPARHLAWFYADALGLDEPPPLRLSPSANARRVVDEAMAGAAGATGRPLVVMHPGSHPGWPQKRAPATWFADLARRLARGTGAFTLLVGTGAERGLCQEIARTAGVGGAVASLAGAIPLSALPELIRRAGLFVGNDSAPLKIAEAVGTRTVSFWMVTRPDRLGPRGDGHRAFQATGPVDPAEVAEAAAALLGRSGSAWAPMLDDGAPVREAP